jgi:arginyl-tRNA synthetase
MIMHASNARPNPLDDLDERLRASVGADNYSLAPALSASSSADAIVVVRDARQDPASVASALAASPSVENVTHSGRRLDVVFRDSHIAEIGAVLERGDGELALDLLKGKRYIVDFCAPNATKALHAGHLRNIALGNAIASSLQAAGARVTRQIQITDAGRRMGEAMAGYSLYADGARPAPGEKGDRFVGELYSRYIQEADTSGSDEEDPALDREMHGHGDLADSLLARLEAGDGPTIELWEAIRAWAVRGQNATLARLGVDWDRQLYESDFREQTVALVDRGLAQGVIARAPNGAVVYETGRDEYEVLPLTRPDGFPTQNLRALTAWHTLMSREPDVELIHLSGDEWRAHTVFVEEILSRLAPGARPYPTVNFLYGMVSSGEQPLSSSEGDAPLIDDLLEELVEDELLRAPELRGASNCRAQELAAIVLLGLCLDRPANKLLVLDRARLLDVEANGGWALAAAWIKAWDSRNDGAPEPAPTDGDYRHLVVQSLVPRRLLPLVVERVDVHPLMRFMVHLSQWYLAADSTSPAVGRAMRSILAEGLGSLGIAPTLEPARMTRPPLAAAALGTAAAVGPRAAVGAGG